MVGLSNSGYFLRKKGRFCLGEIQQIEFPHVYHYYNAYWPLNTWKTTPQHDLKSGQCDPWNNTSEHLGQVLLFYNYICPFKFNINTLSINSSS